MLRLNPNFVTCNMRSGAQHGGARGGLESAAHSCRLESHFWPLLGLALPQALCAAGGREGNHCSLTEASKSELTALAMQALLSIILRCPCEVPQHLFGAYVTSRYELLPGLAYSFFRCIKAFARKYRKVACKCGVVFWIATINVRVLAP